MIAFPPHLGRGGKGVRDSVLADGDSEKVREGGLRGGGGGGLQARVVGIENVASGTVRVAL